MSRLLGDSATRPRRLAAVMIVVAGTLVVMSVLHLTGSAGGAAGPEAAIAVVLLAGAGSVFRRASFGRRAALAATGFAIVGFVAGLHFTIGGHDTFALVYHATMLPVLLATFVALLRSGEDSPGSNGDDFAVPARSN